MVDWLFTLLWILASIDFILTMYWVYRWNSSFYVRRFKYKIPFKLIEANPIIRYMVENNKSGDLYIPITFGYSIVFLIQLSLLKIHWIIGTFVSAVLFGAILLHIKNIIKTNNKHIIKMTVAYNNKRREKNGRK